MSTIPAFIVLSGGMVMDHADTLPDARRKADACQYGGIPDAHVARVFRDTPAPLGSVSYWETAIAAGWYGMDDTENYAFKVV